MSWLSTLGGRILLVTVAVAAVAVLVTAAVSLQLVQTLVTAQARTELAVQTTALSQRSLPTLRILLAEDKILGSHGERFALVGADGRIDGAAVPVVATRIARVLDAGRSVSTTVRVQGEPYLVEGRPRSDGGGLVGFVRAADVSDSSRLVAGRVLLAVVIGLLAAVVAGILLSRRLARPLELTARAARRLAAGERGVSIASQRIPEIDDVASALAALDLALSTSEHRQREFLLSVSHEIRTPLTAIRGYAEALADGVIPADESPAVGEVLVAETKRVDAFVSDLLELARLDADDFAIDPQPIDVAEVLGQVAQAWRGQCTRLGIAMQTDAQASPSGRLTVTTDAMRLRQVIDGLVENALRATPAGGQVVLAASRTGNRVRLEVRDSGPGLTEADAAVAFERGTLRARYRDLRPVNTGLGLSIAARLVTRLGGTIAVRPAPEGGACFAVELVAGS